MNRRDILKYTAYVTGAAVGAPLWATLITGCKIDPPENTTQYTPSFFGKEDFALLQDLIDTLLPKTDSPSATGVGVHVTIDMMVGQGYPSEKQEAYSTGFMALKNYLAKAAGENGFLAMADDRKADILTALETGEADAPKPARRGWLDVRQQTIAYYLASKEVALHHLNYLPVPGGYEPCISLSEVGGKAWAL